MAVLKRTIVFFNTDQWLYIRRAGIQEIDVPRLRLGNGVQSERDYMRDTNVGNSMEAVMEALVHHGGGAYKAVSF